MDIEAEAVQCDDVPVTLDESAASESVHSENDFTVAAAQAFRWADVVSS
jgi:hypothetical protein